MSNSTLKSGTHALALLTQYKKLNARSRESLSPSELKELQELETVLSKMMKTEASRGNEEKRTSIRVPVAKGSYEVEFENVGELGRSYLKNISGGGLYIETSRFLEIGTKTTLKIKLPGEKESLTISVEVAWVNPKVLGDMQPGLGFKFLDLDEKNRTKLKRLFDQALDAAVKPEKKIDS